VGAETRDLKFERPSEDSGVSWPGRFEIARAEPPVIFDSAHNQDSFARLQQTLEDYFPGRQAYLVFGASEDKNLPGMLDEIRGKVRRLFITKADHPRALPPEDIAALALNKGIAHEVRTPVGPPRAGARALEKGIISCPQVRCS
jgi:dihydrofolate synthase/folylpolyglutamate synthase